MAKDVHIHPESSDEDEGATASKRRQVVVVRKTFAFAECIHIFVNSILE